MKKCFALLALLTTSLCTAYAAPPNLTGEWKLNVSKSEFGPIPAPESATRSVKHTDPALEITTHQKGQAGETTTTLKYTTDGKVSENAHVQAKGTAKWDGDKLVIDSVRNFQGTEVKLHDVWTLSADGKTLTVNSQLSVPQGDFEIKWVFEK